MPTLTSQDQVIAEAEAQVAMLLTALVKQIRILTMLDDVTDYRREVKELRQLLTEVHEQVPIDVLPHSSLRLRVMSLVQSCTSAYKLMDVQDEQTAALTARVNDAEAEVVRLRDRIDISKLVFSEANTKLRNSLTEAEKYTPLHPTLAFSVLTRAINNLIGPLPGADQITPANATRNRAHFAHDVLSGTNASSDACGFIMHPLV